MKRENGEITKHASDPRERGLCHMHNVWNATLKFQVTNTPKIKNTVHVCNH